MSGFSLIFKRSVLQLVRRPVYWVAMLLLPLFCFLFLSTLMIDGLPDKAPAGVVDKDGSAISRRIAQNLDGMQMVSVVSTPNSFTEARHLMQEGKIFGFFLIPENFEADLLAGREPQISFYTNMTYYVPASLLFKTFKTTAVYTKAGIASQAISGAGVTADITPLMMPINITTRGIGNPGLNYAWYLCVSFIPCILQLMIMIITCFSLGQEVKFGTSRTLMKMADGSIVKAITAKLLPQTIFWIILALFMESWMFKWQGYPMHGSWGWITLSEIMFVLAAQGFGLFIYGLLPNLRLSLSVACLSGILTFSIAAISFPTESMYGGAAVFSWLVPFRYNFLIYVDQALNGIDIYYSKWWFAAYIIFMLAPLLTMRKLKKAMLNPVYVP